MADIWQNAYDFLAAPARERAAREDAMKNAPSFLDLLAMTHTSGTMGIGKTDRFSTEPQKLKSYFSGTPDQIVPKNTQRWTADSLSPSMTAAERVALARELDRTMVNGFPNPGGPLTIQVNGGGSTPAYAPWGATSRSLAFNALNPSPPQDPMTVAANEAAANFLANPPDFGGRDTGAAPLGTYGGEATKVPASTSTRPRGIAGLLDALFGQSPRMDVATKLDVPSPAQRYDNANAVAQLNAILAPRTGSAGGYQYQNGQKVGYAPVATPFGSATPTSGAQAYSLSNAASKLNAIANSAEPSKNAARASLAAQWGFD